MNIMPFGFVSAVWSEWSDLTPCSLTCGRGTVTRQRTCSGDGCPANRRQTQNAACVVRECRF